MNNNNCTNAKEIKVNEKDLSTSKEGKLRSLRLQSTGLIGHVANAKIMQIAVLSRFTNLTPKIKTTLVKTN